MVQTADIAQAALVEAIAQELIELGYRPAGTASYIVRSSSEPMKVVAPETWAAMRDLGAATQHANRCE